MRSEAIVSERRACGLILIHRATCRYQRRRVRRSAFAAAVARAGCDPATVRLVVHALADGSAHEIAFEAQTYTLALEPVYEFDSPTFRFSFASMACSQEIYDYDLAHRQRILRKKQATPKDFDASAYVARCVFARADDGERVPISLLYRRDLKRDGTAPLLVYGYGAYGHAMDAGFSTNRLSLVDRGFVYAIAHVRGGTEKGWRWYEAGKFEPSPIPSAISSPSRAISH